MYFRTLAATFAALIVAVTVPAQARPHAHGSNHQTTLASSSSDDDEATQTRRTHRRHSHNRSTDDTFGTESHRSASYRGGVGARPGAWCGWYMRTRHGGGPEMNLAANWRHYGSASSAQVGAIVVWPHHVGEIVGRAANGQWIVLSGNDSGRVRSRPRSIAGAVIRS